MSLDTLKSPVVLSLPPSVSLDEHATELLYAPVETENGKVPAIELAERYLCSPYATYMDDFQPLRFSGPYGYEPDHMIEDLGQNVFPVGHQLETGLYVALYLSRRHEAHGDYGFPKDQIGPLVLGALTHDSGETLEPSIVAATGAAIGDIPFGCKTPEERAGEALNRIAVDQQVFPDVDPDALAYKESIISHKDTTMAHEAYAAGHDFADYNTGLTAGSVALNQLHLLETDPKAMTRNLFEIAQQMRLSNDVSRTMTPRLISIARHLQLRPK